MKINLNIYVSLEEANDLFVSIVNLNGWKGPCVETRDYPNGTKPSPDDREMMRALYRSTMSRGIKPMSPMGSLTWEDFYEPHELDENGPIAELFVSAKEIAYNKKQSAAKRLTQKNRDRTQRASKCTSDSSTV